MGIDMMRNDAYYDYRAYRKPRMKTLTFSLYLIMFGVILGVFLTNFLGPVLRNENTGDDNAINAVPGGGAGSAPQSNLAAQMLPMGSGNGTEFTAADYDRAVVNVTERSLPAVVSIHVKGTLNYVINDPYLRLLYGNQIARKPISGMGSGVIIDPDGTIITNDHVINIANQMNVDFAKSNIEIQVVLNDGRTFPAKVLQHFPVLDIAIISIDAKNLPYLELDSSGGARQGQTVLAIGNPFGDALTGGLLGSEPTVTKGIISATRRNLAIPTSTFTRYYRNMLQTDASINEGNSGGALINLDGKLVGINTAIMSPNGTGSIGIGFAFPADRVRLVFDHMKDGNDIGRWYTGIRVQELTPPLASSLAYNGTGVLTVDVEKNSPGDKSGLKKSDIIVKVDGFTVTSPSEVMNIFQGALPGEKVRLSIFRNSAFIDMTLEVGYSQ